MTDKITPATYDGQLADLAAELLGSLDIEGRLDLLGEMDEDDMRTTLAFVAALHPQVFDQGIVRDRAMTARLQAAAR